VVTDDGHDQDGDRLPGHGPISVRASGNLSDDFSYITLDENEPSSPTQTGNQATGKVS
jgi:hypothetical protein